MWNERPIDNPHIAEVLAEFQRLCRYHDLVGGCTVGDAKEMGYSYAIFTTWNGFVADATTPLGFRIRIKTADLGAERAQAVAEGAGWTCGMLLAFATQTSRWFKDVLQLLRRNGMRVTYRPFGGARLPRLRGENYATGDAPPAGQERDA